MKRAGRIVYRLMSGLSLLLLLATVVVSVRSYWVSDVILSYDWPQDRSFLDAKSIWCSRGGLGLLAQRFIGSNVHSADGLRFEHNRHPATNYPDFGEELGGSFAPRPRRYAALGFEWIPQSTIKYFRSPNADVVFTSLTLPLYFPTLLFAILPAHYLLRVCRRRRMVRRIAQGRCIGCGYDLRASSGRCPECGREESSANPRE